MTDLALTDRCPAWCGRHEYQDDDLVVHESVVGFAGPLEVALMRSVLPNETVDELCLRDLGGHSTAQEEITMPLDMSAVRALAELLGQVAGQLSEGSPESRR